VSLIQVSDEQFLNWFDLSRPSMKEALELQAAGNIHGAALAAACAAGEGAHGGAMVGGKDIAPTREAISKHFPRAIDLEIATAKVFQLAEIPDAKTFGPVDDLILGHRARTARRRGNETLIFALLYATTGEKRWAKAGIDAALKTAATILAYPEGDNPPAYGWHPHSDDAVQGHDTAHQLQYWMQAWPLLDDALQPEDRLRWMKVIIHSARDRYRANKHEIPFNLTLHPLMPCLEVGAAFPALKESPEWLGFMVERLEKDYCALPFVSPDGYTRESVMYHYVNTRLLTVAYLTLLRSTGKENAALRRTLEGAYAIIALNLCPDGSAWMLGDSSPHSFHEHWQDGHEALHAGAAMFNRPEWKYAAGSVKGAEPELLNLWLMGAEGIARWVSWPKIDVAARRLPNAHAPSSVFHALRAGKGVDAHPGILSFSSEHNHAHHDKGSVLIYGLGRHLISDPGHPGYPPTDMNPGFSTKVHSVVNIIRRTPMGPRTDHSDYVKSLGHVDGDTISAAMGEHTHFENHIVRRALALASPHGRANGDDAFWIVIDRVTWKRGWPAGATEPYELIETIFPYHAPACSAKVSSDGRSVMSQYNGPDGAPYNAGGPTRAELRTAFEQSDSDANLQITRLETEKSTAQWDIEVRAGTTNSQGGEKAPRPMAVFRWRGWLPHVSAYVLVPYRGVRDTEFAKVSGQATADGCVARVGKFEAVLRGFDSGKLSAELRRV
jgi:hypothetical protein